MLDPYMRRLIDPPLNAAGRFLSAKGISAGVMTVVGFLTGIAAMAFIAIGKYSLGALCIFLNRLCDGLDGAIARASAPTDFGGFLDIVCDFIIYTGIVFAFGLSRKDNLIYALFLMFSFAGPMVSFLAYGILAAKGGLTTTARGVKSFYHLGGICEGTETAFVLILMAIIPPYFGALCVIYGVLCWATTAGRIYAARHDFPSDIRRC